MVMKKGLIDMNLSYLLTFIPTLIESSKLLNYLHIQLIQYIQFRHIIRIYFIAVLFEQVRLTDAWYDDEVVYLSWAMDPPSTRRFRCTGMTASRAGGLPKHVACHRAAPANVLLRGLKIDPVEEYT